MIALLKKYMDIDESNIAINLDHGDSEIALVANVPVLRVKRGHSEIDSSERNFTERNSQDESRAVRGSVRNHNKNRRHR